MNLFCEVRPVSDTVSDDAPLELYWDATYAIVISLQNSYPDISPIDVGLLELAELVEQLPGFRDDPALVTERILLDIQTAWYEETDQ